MTNTIKLPTITTNQRGQTSLQHVPAPITPEYQEAREHHRNWLSIPARPACILSWVLVGLNGSLTLTAILRAIGSMRLLAVVALGIMLCVAIGRVMWKRDEEVRWGLLLVGVVSLVGVVGGML